MSKFRSRNRAISNQSDSRFLTKSLTTLHDLAERQLHLVRVLRNAEDYHYKWDGNSGEFKDEMYIFNPTENDFVFKLKRTSEKVIHVSPGFGYLKAGQLQLIKVIDVKLSDNYMETLDKENHLTVLVGSAPANRPQKCRDVWGNGNQSMFVVEKKIPLRIVFTPEEKPCETKEPGSSSGDVDVSSKKDKSDKESSSKKEKSDSSDTESSSRKDASDSSDEESLSEKEISDSSEVGSSSKKHISVKEHLSYGKDEEDLPRKIISVTDASLKTAESIEDSLDGDEESDSTEELDKPTAIARNEEDDEEQIESDNVQSPESPINLMSAIGVTSTGSIASNSKSKHKEIYKDNEDDDKDDYGSSSSSVSMTTASTNTDSSK